MIDNPLSPFGAGVVYQTKDGRVLLLERAESSDFPGAWCWPGGHIDPGEDPEQAARRESKEEIGYSPASLVLLEEHDGFVTFKSGTNIEVPVTLNPEHTASMWVDPLVAANTMNLHPGVRGTILRHFAKLSSRFYVQERLGPRRSYTAEGFMLCENVPIARSGSMLYAAHELPGVTPDGNGIIRVDRSLEEIMAPTAIASFAGKNITIGHPPEDVDATNWKKYSVGEIHNPRPGEGEFTDCIVADLLVKDPRAIKLINDGQDEVSCGYDADYKVLSPGQAQQLNILGNHIALVKNGRCGPRCSIGDSEMPKMSLAERIRSKFLRIGDEVAAELEKEESSTTKDENKEFPPKKEDEKETKTEENKEAPSKDCDKPVTKDEGPAGLTEVLQRLQVLEDNVKALTEKVDKMVSAEKAEAERTMANDEAVDPPEGSMATGDEDILDGGDIHEGSANALTKDSSIILDVRSRCEILAPGMRFMTVDAGMDQTKLGEGLCLMRRRALAASLAGAEKDVVSPLLPGGIPSIRSMTCDAAAAIFVGASELVKASRKQRTGGVTKKTSDHGVGMVTDVISGINAANREFWKNKH